MSDTKQTTKKTETKAPRQGSLISCQLYLLIKKMAKVKKTKKMLDKKNNLTRIIKKKIKNQRDNMSINLERITTRKELWLL